MTITRVAGDSSRHSRALTHVTCAVAGSTAIGECTQTTRLLTDEADLR